jgi:hypothetical protein
MAAPGFREKPHVYDVLWIGTIPMPGEWDCHEIGRQLKVKQPKASGDDAGPLRVTGLEITKGSITSKLHTDEDEEVWTELLAEIFPVNRPAKRNIHSISHPQFARHGITQIVVERVSEGRPRGGDPMPVRIDWRVANHRSGKTAKPKKANSGSHAGSSAFDPATQPPLIPTERQIAAVAQAAGGGGPAPALQNKSPLNQDDLALLPTGKQVLQSLPR